jgi:hypothetical protein
VHLDKGFANNPTIMLLVVGCSKHGAHGYVRPRPERYIDQSYQMVIERRATMTVENRRNP